MAGFCKGVLSVRTISIEETRSLETPRATSLKFPGAGLTNRSTMPGALWSKDLNGFLYLDQEE